LPARLALALNAGAASPFDNIANWAKPDWVTKSDKLKTKKDKQ
jgi:hypothetical protein